MWKIRSDKSTRNPLKLDMPPCTSKRKSSSAPPSISSTLLSMALSISPLHLNLRPTLSPFAQVRLQKLAPGSRRALPISAGSRESSGNGRRIWRRRKLTRKDDRLQYGMERIPFLEEQVRKIRETGKIISMDIEKLLLSEENRFDFVNEVAAEATAYVENDPDEYGDKKPILHVLSNRVNESGFHRSEGYLETDPFRPGPTYLRDHLS